MIERSPSRFGGSRFTLLDLGTPLRLVAIVAGLAIWAGLGLAAEIRVQVIDSRTARPKPEAAVDVVALRCSDFRDCRGAWNNYIHRCLRTPSCNEPRVRVVRAQTDRAGIILTTIDPKTEPMVMFVLNHGEMWMCLPYARGTPPRIFEVDARSRRALSRNSAGARTVSWSPIWLCRAKLLSFGTGCLLGGVYSTHRFGEADSDEPDWR